MDFLSHLFLPLIAAYVLRRELFDSPWFLGLAVFGLLADFDKFLGMPGLLHSLLTLGPLCAGIVGLEHTLRDELTVSPVVVGLIGSHLVLDFVDGGPVPLLFPLIETGIGLQYPANTIFGEGLLGVRFDRPLASLRTTAPRPGNRTYGFIKGAGVASMLLFGLIYLTDQWQNRASQFRDSTSANTSRHEGESAKEEGLQSEH